MIGNTYTRLTGFGFFFSEGDTREGFVNKEHALLLLFMWKKNCKQNPLSKAVGTARDERPFFKELGDFFSGFLCCVERRKVRRTVNLKIDGFPAFLYGHPSPTQFFGNCLNAEAIGIREEFWFGGKIAAANCEKGTEAVFERQRLALVYDLFKISNQLKCRKELALIWSC